jgi:2-methylcitrate dehydratase PrpD
MYDDPQDALQAKFSLEYGVAVALLSGNCTLADFTEEAALRPDIRAWFPRIHRHPVDKAEGEFPTQVHVTLTDGRTLDTEIAWPAGSLAVPFTLDQHWAKFEGCAAGMLAPEALEAVREALANLPRLPSIQTLMTPLRGSR